ncbi:glycosyltransferase family 2 protein [Psychroserpens sp.]|uniref:glycosyltransferase family 2 protein n=1 Tax=Psychroserpens sp. TaxID=2020870 RepID=UPI00385D027E
MLLILILAVMISVLIPIYNYNVVTLVTQIHAQLQLCDIPFEIICLDDASTSDCVVKNEKISNFEFITYLKSNTNLGRTSARQYLSGKATYEWLLFLDADVIPKSEKFIKNYLNLITSEYEAIYGGICYDIKKPEADSMLRWVYGKANEEVNASTRNKTVYKSIVSANFLMKKTIFINLNSKIEGKGYGYDNYFGTLLKSNNIKVLHIDNEVFHYGLEPNEAYITKKEKAAETLLKLYNSGKIDTHQNDLLKLYIHLKRFRLRSIFSLIYKVFKTMFKRHLSGSKPSIKILQLYRICYMCHLDKNQL